MKITRLEIKSADLAAQLPFYRDLLELEILHYDDKSFEVMMGYTVLKFIKDTQAVPYHIAIHIPDRQEKKALQWIKGRVPVLKNHDEEIIDFSGWNAKSLYFYDRDENIMEFIARRNFNEPETSNFSGNSLVGVAEVGLATGDILEKYNFLHEHCGLEVFDGNFEKFCAVGDDEGLLITINKDLKDWFPTDDKAYAAEFIIEFSHSGNLHRIAFQNDRLSPITN